MPDTPEGFGKIFAGQLDVVTQWMKDHGVIAWVILVVLVVIFFTKPSFDAFDVWWARLLAPVGKKWKFRGLVRAAVKCDVRGFANKAIRQLAPQLPDGWIPELDINWVDNETRQQFFENGKIVVHVRPLEDQEVNFVSIVHLFLQEALFPRVKMIVPETQRTAAILYFGDRIAAARSERTAEVFGQRIFEPIVGKKKKVLEFFQRYTELDAKGYFSGAFIREIQHVAREVRATRLRDNMSAEMNAALTHLEEFAKGYAKSQLDHVMMPESAWIRNGIMTKYALLLVANPAKAAIDDLGAGYVARAQQRYREGVRRLYVFGTAGQRNYAKQVLREIAFKTPYTLEQEFELHRDYRGDAGGLGALFVLPPAVDVAAAAEVAG